MSNKAPAGFDGPYPAPIEIEGGTVEAGWIDYNGHMNVAYYVLAFDRAIDRLLEDVLGIGESFVETDKMGPYALQSSIHYLGEMLKGQAFSFSALMIDADAKRMHLLVRMLTEGGTVAATYEQLLMNVDLETRRSTAYPDWAAARIARMVEDHAATPRPPQFGQPLGIRRR